MANIINPTDIRKRLLANGYKPLPAIDKRCVIANWSKLVIDESFIDRFDRASAYTSTALRLDGLSMLDTDISDSAVAALVRARWAEAFPDLFDNMDIPLLERGTDVSCKVAFILARDEDTANIVRSIRFIKPGQAPQDAQFVEVLSGNGRYAGAIGLHDSKKGSTYVWPADSPLDIERTALPVLKTKDIDALLDIAEAAFVELGYVAVERSQRGHYESEHVYDITDAMLFDCEDGVTRTLEEMKQAAAGEQGLRCTAAWHDKTSNNPTSCIARMAPSGFIITDFHTDLIHHELSAKPEPLPDIAALFPAIDALGGAKPPHGVPGCANMMAAWIARNYVWMPTAAKTQVIPIGVGTIGENAMSITNFRLDCAPWKEEVQSGPRGGWRKISAVDVWLCDEDNRKRAVGFALRPDMPRPLYSEDGEWWINTYKPPVHDAAGGSCDLLLTFLKGLTPKPVEYAYKMQCLAHKKRHPEVPGPGLIMVAQDKFGVGRGAFAALLEKIFGYTETIQYDVFTGNVKNNAQAAYNGYEARNLIVVVDEANGHQGWAARDGTAAKIRDRMSPNARKRQIIEKGVPHWSVMVHVTYVILANDFDMFNMHVRDRRAVVFTNGEPQPPEFYDAVYASINTPGDVARLVDHLMTIDLSDFKPYAPPLMTQGKYLMVEESENDIDRGLRIIMKAIAGRGELFSALHVINGMSAIAHEEQLDYSNGWEKVVQRLLGKRYARVGVEDGVNWKPMFAGRRYPTFAWSEALADKWKEVDAHFVKIELRRTGKLDSQFGVGFAAYQWGEDDGQQTDTAPDIP